MTSASPRAEMAPSDAWSCVHIREQAALQTLVRNKWFTADKVGGQIRMGLGERAPELREGRASASQAA